MFIQQLQQLSAAAAVSNAFIPPNSQINFTSTDLKNASWDTPTNRWLNQAQVAAMLPMYNIFQNRYLKFVKY